MAFKIEIPFFVATMKLSSGDTMMAPLNDNETILINQGINQVLEKYESAFQKAVLNKGDYLSLMDEYSGDEHYTGKFEVDFPAARDGISFPEFTLEFVYYFKKLGDGAMAYIPALAAESFVENIELIEEVLTEAVKLEFARRKRLVVVQRIVSAIWFDTISLEKSALHLKSYPPQELSELSTAQEQSLLPKSAKKLDQNIPKIYGRTVELEQLYKAINGKFNRNVLLVGPSGVGKTALIWELARQRKKLKLNFDIWETTASTLVKELTMDMGWQFNLGILARELAASGDFLYVRNLLELFEVGKYEGNSVSMAEFMRPFISRGELNFISEGTTEEIQRIELQHPNYLSNFQVIRLEEPQEGMEDMIINKVNDLAHSSKVKLEREAIEETIRLQKRFMPYSGFPAKPIRFLEGILINQKGQSPKIKSLKTLSRDTVLKYFSEDSGMPEFMINPEIPMDLEVVKKTFNANVFGQRKAVNEIVDLMGAVKTALTRTGKPIASFLFVGPTGVGKTEMTKVLSEFMFGARNRMIRFDMSEYADPYSVLRLRGVNYFSDGLLTSAVRRQPFSVLLFDEIEKADASFYDLLLQILGDGRLTDSKGQLVNFCSAIIIMTSNIGAADLQTNKIGWNKTVDVQGVTDHFMKAVQDHFRPELFNRIDQLIPFKPLSKEVVRNVVDRELALLKKREGIKFRNVDLKIETSELDYLAEKGYDLKYGARQLQRTIKKELIVPLSKALNEFDYDDQVVVEVKANENKLDLNISSDELALELVLENYQKNIYADYASSLRRQLQGLRRSHLYINLLSRLDILDHKKEAEKDQFWENKFVAEEYSYLLDTKNKVDYFLKEIEGMEEKAALAVMDIQHYQPKLIDELEKWERRFFNLRVELYARLNSEFNKAYINIYGLELESIANFYMSILNQKQFKFTTQLYWYNKEHYDKEVIAFHEKTTSSPKFYKTEHYPRANLNTTLLEQKDLLVGICFKVEGTAVFHYFELESGLQAWEDKEKKEHRFMVNVNSGKQNPPTGIHRQNTYQKQNLRRKVDGNKLVDIYYKIDKEIGPSQRVNFMQETLDEKFKSTIIAKLT